MVNKLNKPSRVSSILIRWLILTPLCHILAKILVNYIYKSTAIEHFFFLLQTIIYIISDSFSSALNKSSNTVKKSTLSEATNGFAFFFFFFNRRLLLTAPLSRECCLYGLSFISRTSFRGLTMSLVTDITIINAKTHYLTVLASSIHPHSPVGVPVA